MLTPSKKFLLGLKLAIFAVKWPSFGYFCQEHATKLVGLSTGLLLVGSIDEVTCVAETQVQCTVTRV